MNAINDLSPSVIHLKNIRFAYKTEIVLNDVSLKIDQGELVGVIGPNGSGKSTLLKLMAGILYPDQGLVDFMDRNIGSIKRRELAQTLSWIPQENHLTFPFQGMEVVLMGRHPYLGPMSFEKKKDISVAEWAMDLTNTRQFSSRLFTEISGGEKQRVILASAIAQEPEVMILDEPTSALDIKYQIEILKILKKLNKEQQMTQVLAMHDLQLASRFCKRLILLDKGEIVHDGSPHEVLTEKLLGKVYGVRIKVFTNEDNGSLIIYPS
tara:strand:- start:236 stop:1033 length:798 start_codon:yes stop_codon:yes gene_type:complete